MFDNDNDDLRDKRENISGNLKYMFQKVTGTADYTEKYKEQDRVDNRTMALLSYLIPLIPFIVERNSAYVRFHSSQGMNLFIWYILIMAFISMVDTAFQFPFAQKVTSFLFGVITLIFFLLILFGVKNTWNNYAKEIPITSKFNIISIIGTFFGK